MVMMDRLSVKGLADFHKIQPVIPSSTLFEVYRLLHCSQFLSKKEKENIRNATVIHILFVIFLTGQGARRKTTLSLYLKRKK